MSIVLDWLMFEYSLYSEVKCFRYLTANAMIYLIEDYKEGLNIHVYCRIKISLRYNSS